MIVITIHGQPNTTGQAGHTRSRIAGQLEDARIGPFALGIVGGNYYAPGRADSYIFLKVEGPEPTLGNHLDEIMHRLGELYWDIHVPQRGEWAPAGKRDPRNIGFKFAFDRSEHKKMMSPNDVAGLLADVVRDAGVSTLGQLCDLHRSKFRGYSWQDAWALLNEYDIPANW